MLELLPVPRFAVRGAVAFGGTWAIGEALRRRFADRFRPTAVLGSLANRKEGSGWG